MPELSMQLLVRHLPSGMAAGMGQGATHAATTRETVPQRGRAQGTSEEKDRVMTAILIGGAVAILIILHSCWRREHL